MGASAATPSVLGSAETQLNLIPVTTNIGLSNQRTKEVVTFARRLSMSRKANVSEQHMATTLFIGNLPHTATDQSLREFVNRAGVQVASNVVIRGKTCITSGFALVELAQGEDSQRAVASMNGQTLDGWHLTIIEARSQRTDFVRPRDGGGPDSFRRGQ